MTEESSTTTTAAATTTAIPSLRPIYEESSQYRHWRFNASQLWESRNTSHEAAVKRVRRNFEEDQVNILIIISLDRSMKNKIKIKSTIYDIKIELLF